LKGSIKKGRLTKDLTTRVVLFRNCTEKWAQINNVNGVSAVTVVDDCVDRADTSVVIVSTPGVYIVRDNETDLIKKRFGSGLCEIKNISEPADLVTKLLDDSSNCTAILSYSKGDVVIGDTLSYAGVSVFVGDMPIYVLNKTCRGLP